MSSSERQHANSSSAKGKIVKSNITTQSTSGSSNSYIEFSIKPDDFLPVPSSHPEITTFPFFIQKGFQIDKYFAKSIELLTFFIDEAKLDPKKYPKDFIYNIRASITQASICSNKVRRMYKVMTAIILSGFVHEIENYVATKFPNYSEDKKKEKIKKLKKLKLAELGLATGNATKINIDKLMELAPAYFNDSLDEVILNNYQFKQFLKEIVMSVQDLMKYLNKAAYYVFQNIYTKLGKNNVDQILDFQETHEKMFNSHQYYRFYTIHKYIFDFIENGLGNLKEIYTFDNDFGDKRLMMPAVFYEYFLYHSLNYMIGENIIDFHDENGKKINEEWEIIDMQGLKSKFSITTEIINDNIKYIDQDNTQIFMNFQYYCVNHSDVDFKIAAKGNFAFFHPKTTGSSSNGFWISFSNSNDRFYFKELYCLSENFERNHYKRINVILQDRSRYLKYATNIRRVKEFYNFITPKKENLDYFSHAKAYNFLYQLHAKEPYDNDPDYILSEFHHINEYVELSGYFLLELFGLMPKVDAFNSHFFRKPIISVKGLNDNYHLVLEMKNRKYERLDLSNANNDIRSNYLSSIPIMSLRLIQVIFLIDDFHEQNIAVSTKEFKRGKYIFQYINNIMAIDIWPSYIRYGTSYLFAPDLNNKSEELDKLPFDDLIMYYVDTGFKTNLKDVYYDRSKEMLDSIFYNSDKKNRMNAFISSIIINKSLECPDKVTIPRLISTYFAMTDLFDEVYFKYPDIFKQLETTKVTLLTQEVARIMLDYTYKKSTEATKALNKLPEVFKLPDDGLSYGYTRDEWLSLAWKKYIDRALQMIDDIIKILKQKLFYYDTCEDIFAYRIIQDIHDQEDPIKIKSTSFAEIKMIMNNLDNSIVGTIFLGNELKDNVDKLSPQMLWRITRENEYSNSKLKNIEGNFYFYAFDSPLKYDITNYHLESKSNKFIDENNEIHPNLYRKKKAV